MELNRPRPHIAIPISNDEWRAVQALRNTNRLVGLHVERLDEGTLVITAWWYAHEMSVMLLVNEDVVLTEERREQYREYLVLRNQSDLAASVASGASEADVLSARESFPYQVALVTSNTIEHGHWPDALLDGKALDL